MRTHVTEENPNQLYTASSPEEWYALTILEAVRTLQPPVSPLVLAQILCGIQSHPVARYEYYLHRFFGRLTGRVTGLATLRYTQALIRAGYMIRGDKRPYGLALTAQGEEALAARAAICLPSVIQPVVADNIDGDAQTQQLTNGTAAGITVAESAATSALATEAPPIVHQRSLDSPLSPDARQLTKPVQQLLKEHGFAQTYRVKGKRYIFHLFRQQSRCGIYVLHFSEGDCYVGQSTSIPHRFVQHVKDHGDIEYISFRRLPRKELDPVEVETIFAFDEAGIELRNFMWVWMGTPPSDDLLRIYFDEIHQTPLLSAEEERNLARTVQHGRVAKRKLTRKQSLTASEYQSLLSAQMEGNRARTQLIVANTRLVVHIARRFRHPSVPLADRIQAGNIGLMRAAERFDPERGNRFSTYAWWWIRQTIRRSLDTNAPIVHVPVHMQEACRRYRRVKWQLTKKLDREPTAQELTIGLGLELAAGAVPESTWHQLKRLARATATIQRPFHLDSYDDTRLPDELTVPNPAGQVVEEVNKEHLRIAIGEALRKLSPRQAKILMLRFGLHDGTPHTLEEIGQRLGVTRERIRQLEDKALRRLRHPSLSAKLRLYHDQE